VKCKTRVEAMLITESTNVQFSLLLYVKSLTWNKMLYDIICQKLDGNVYVLQLTLLGPQSPKEATDNCR
jgi:hypothetical protein